MINADLLGLAQPVDSVSLLPGNPRRGNINAVAESLKRFGQRKPIVARASDRVVIAGNHTLQAAVLLGWDEVAVSFVDDDEATSQAYALADNRISDLSSYDDQALLDLLESVEIFDGTGYALADMESLAELLYPSIDEIPNFMPDDSEQPKLDERSSTTCPKCKCEWRIGPGKEVIYI
jgi:ParB-like chromosome segregation protein Spo0J